MKKVVLSAVVIIVFALYAWHGHFNNENAAVVPPSSGQTSSSGPNPNSSQSSQSSSSTPNPSASYKDGSYTGNNVDAYYGFVQVKATVSGGKITDVQFLDYPQDRRTSIEINSQAMPYLTQEAIQAQSAQVDTVSGATATSGAFRDSLQSALDQAKN